MLYRRPQACPQACWPSAPSSEWVCVAREALGAQGQVVQQHAMAGPAPARSRRVRRDTQWQSLALRRHARVSLNANGTPASLCCGGQRRRTEGSRAPERTGAHTFMRDLVPGPVESSPGPRPRRQHGIGRPLGAPTNSGGFPISPLSPTAIHNECIFPSTRVFQHDLFEGTIPKHASPIDRMVGLQHKWVTSSNLPAIARSRRASTSQSKRSELCRSKGEKSHAMALPMRCFWADLPLLEITACTQHPVVVNRICELFCAPPRNKLQVK